VQSLPSALQKRVTHVVTPCLTLALASPLEFAVMKNASRKSFGMRSCKIIGLKVPWNEHLSKRGGGRCRILICNSLLKKCFFSVIPGEATNLPFGKPREREIPRRLRLLGMTVSASFQQRFTASDSPRGVAASRWQPCWP